MAMMDVDVDTDIELSKDNLKFQEYRIKTQDLEIGITSKFTPMDLGDNDNQQTHTFNKFPNSADSDDEDYKTDLLKGEKKQHSFWTFEYYQQFFDVDTWQVLRRITGSMIPNPKTNFLEYQIRPNPDMYGPFWICTTLIFTTAIAGNMANYIQHAGQNYDWHYDFHKVTFAATAIFSYWLIIPTLLWALLRWRNSLFLFSFLEIICVYGYSLSIYIPISILWVIPINWLQWILVLIGMMLSGSVLVLTFWPAVREDDRKMAYLVMALIVIFHGTLAAGFVLYFFYVPNSHVDPGISTSSLVKNDTHV